jgi:protocatechuate 3,4-dioxygenase beta subunit
MPLSRRRLLELVAAIPVALATTRVAAAGRRQDLSRFTTPSVPCKPSHPTPAAPDTATYRTGSPERTVLAPAGAPGRRLVLTGTVAGVVCGPINGALLDFWQADAQGHYDMSGLRWRGHQRTDATGAYRLETVVPGADGRRAPHLDVSVQAPGKPALMTQLFFPEDPRNVHDAAFRSDLVMSVRPAGNGLAATFDFVLDL